MVFLIDPRDLKGKKCPTKTCDIFCSDLCKLFYICNPENVPLYGIPPI